MRWLLVVLALLLGAAGPVLPDYAVVKPGAVLRFPADHGAHPEFRTEWWYVTGWLRTADGKDLGFQFTVFRTRPPVDQANPSRFAAKQVIFAHAALSDPSIGHLLHDQRIARAGFGLADAAIGNARLVIDDWQLLRAADGRFHAAVASRAKGSAFALDLTLTPGQAELLQGDAGYSRKGPSAREASHYYSVPHLRVTGSVVRGGVRQAVTGTAWLDREWSSTLLNPAAVGWDWTGLNLDDGSALTLFRVRDAKGAALWAGGSLRRGDGSRLTFAPGDVRFASARQWRSPRTGALYPVAPVVGARIDGRWHEWPVTPLFDDQELDSRRGGGPVYWEGAVRVPGGRGYLELTGYQSALKM